MSNRVERGVNGEAEVALERRSKLGRNDVIENGVECRVGVECDAAQDEYREVVD